MFGVLPVLLGVRQRNYGGTTVALRNCFGCIRLVIASVPVLERILHQSIRQMDLWVLCLGFYGFGKLSNMEFPGPKTGSGI